MKRLLTFILAVCLLTFCETAFAKELIGADSTGKNAAGQLWGEKIAQRVSELTGGKLTIDYHPNGELGGDTDLIRQMQFGDIGLVVCQPAPLVSFIPEMAVFDLPMVFARYDGETIDRVLNGDNEFRKRLNAAYEVRGLRLLGLLQNGTYRMTTANHPLYTFEDFKGLQIRTMENRNHIAFWRAMGAEPTPLAWAEVYIALQNGTIDAQENAADTCAGASFQEVQKYLACTNHILYVNQVCMNLDEYESLSDEYQNALVQAVADATAYMRPQLKRMDEENRQKLTDGGMILIEYGDEFYQKILESDDVQKLYKVIDEEQISGLGTLLSEALAHPN